MLKYPRTPHLPWSPGATSDDKRLADTRHFSGISVQVSEKMDGENTTLTREHVHARSPDSKAHPSRDWVRRFWAERRHLIPQGWRICGENLFARHSIHYKALPSYFLGFSVWNEDNICLSLDESGRVLADIGIDAVPEIWRGVFQEKAVKEIGEKLMRRDDVEGYVVRALGAFTFSDFSTHVAKYVRAQHVNSDIHWLNQPLVRNGLA